MTSSQSDLMRLVHRAALLSERVGERAFQSGAGLGRATYLVLRTIDDAALADEPPLSQQELADRLGLGKAVVSRHVARAEQEAWLVARPSPTSRRERALALTAAGRRLVARGRLVQEAMETDGARSLAADEVAVATRVLTTVCDQLVARERGR